MLDTIAYTQNLNASAPEDGRFTPNHPHHPHGAAAVLSRRDDDGSLDTAALRLHGTQAPLWARLEGKLAKGRGLLTDDPVLRYLMNEKDAAAAAPWMPQRLVTGALLLCRLLLCRLLLLHMPWCDEMVTRAYLLCHGTALPCEIIIATHNLLHTTQH